MSRACVCLAACALVVGCKKTEPQPEVRPFGAVGQMRPDEFYLDTEEVRERTQEVGRLSLAEIAEESERIAPIVSRLVFEQGAALKPGMTTREVHDRVLGGLGAEDLAPALAGFNGFPAGLAVSVNDELLHAIPGARELAAGDVVTLEAVTVSTRAFAGQTWSFFVGEPSAASLVMYDAAHAALHAAIASIAPTARVGDLSAAIQSTAEAAGLSVVAQSVGHGMGRKRVVPPRLPGVGVAGQGERFRVGQILHVYVVLKAGSPHATIGDDGFTLQAADEKPGLALSAMVQVRTGGAKVLSRLPPAADRPGPAAADP